MFIETYIEMTDKEVVVIDEVLCRIDSLLNRVFENISVSTGSELGHEVLDAFVIISQSKIGLQKLCSKYCNCFPYFIALLYNDDKAIVEKCLTLISCITTLKEGCNILMSLEPKDFRNLAIENPCQKFKKFNVVVSLMDHMFKYPSKISELATAAFVNLTREDDNVKIINSFIRNIDNLVARIMKCVLRGNQNSDEGFQYFLYILLNLSSKLQLVRKLFVNPKKGYLLTILSLIKSHKTIERSTGLQIIKNLALDAETNKSLLDFEVDVIGSLLYPLAGADNYSEEEIEKFPYELQYMSSKKQREEDPSIRLLILEILYQLCATQYGREHIRNKNTYLILRDYHKWETDENCVTCCEDVVNVLIRTEEEIGVDNLKIIDTLEGHS